MEPVRGKVIKKCLKLADNSDVCRFKAQVFITMKN